jgi:hypothetical protein
VNRSFDSAFADRAIARGKESAWPSSTQLRSGAAVTFG